MASAQLQLISTDATWKLDRRTVEIGRAGIAQARAALAAATVVTETDIFASVTEARNETRDKALNQRRDEALVGHRAAA